MPAVRRFPPVRTCTTVYNYYQKYKPHLRADFYRLCGYCGEHDMYSGGQRGFHIDHFRPKSQFPGLKTNYSNLVYACPYCNLAKSDDWVGDNAISILNGKGYIDPCDANFESHIQRNVSGTIIPITDVGKYMHTKLNLGLLRRQLTWLMDELDGTLGRLEFELHQFDTSHPTYVKLLQTYFEVSTEFRKYYKQYRDAI